jgi:DNA-binding MurR/RpiR family transcriptional regulator
MSSRDESARSFTLRLGGKMSTEPVPRDFEGLKKLLIARQHAFPKRLQQAAAFAVDNPDEIAFGTAARIADLAQIQPSTLVRFAKAIGYQGFSDLQKVFRSRLRERWPDYADRLNRIQIDHSPKDQPMHLLFGFADSGVASLQRLKETIRPTDLERAISLLADAQSIYLLGQRRTYPVSAYLAYSMSKLGIDAHLIDNVGSLGAEQVGNAGPRCALLSLSFTPYTPLTIQLTNAAADRGVPIVAITDSAFSPLVQFASVWFEVVESDFGAFRSIAATFALATTLAVGIAHRRAARS